jgi:large subunit ribosomal protein L34
VTEYKIYRTDLFPGRGSCIHLQLGKEDASPVHSYPISPFLYFLALQAFETESTMSSLRCLRAFAPLQPTSSPALTLRQCNVQAYALTSLLTRSPIKAANTLSSLKQQQRNLTLLTPRRPQLQRIQAHTAPSSLPGTLPPTMPGSAQETLDLLPKITAHPALSSIQVRCGPRDTYNMTHLVRKRRFGFLARKRSRTGRKILKRRMAKGRYNLSHR